MGGKNSSLQPAIKFYKDLTKAKTMLNVPNKALRESIKLVVSIENCDHTEYEFKAFDSSINPPRLLGSSEKTKPDDLKIVHFQTSFIMEYYFEKEQPVLIKIFKKKGGDLETIEMKTSIGSIVGSRNNTLNKKIDNIHEEVLVISATELKDNQEYLNIVFDVSSNIPLKFKKTKNFFNYMISNRTNLYQSETISSVGKFNPAHIPMNLLSPDFTITFYDCKKKPVYTLKTTFQEFLAEGGKYSKFEFPLSSNRTIYIANRSSIRKSYSFIDYLKSGVQIGMAIAIDFTGSNGNPSSPTSLHAIKPGLPNDYERAIFSCGNIVAYYDYDQQFPAFGFGAELPGQTQTSMCFPINMQQNPEIYTIQGVIDCYHSVITQVTFSGPTYFGPILEKMISMIQAENNKLKYNILLILTDGMINDMTRSIDLLVQGSKLPLSVIIVGIGNANFGNMETLDADDSPLISSTGERSCRDLVQFVPFNRYEHNGEKLAEIVLEEIPTQIVQYYAMNQLYPENINK